MRKNEYDGAICPTRFIENPSLYIISVQYIIKDQTKEETKNEN